MTRTFETEDDATNFALTWLRSRGYSIQRIDESGLLPPVKLRRRLRLGSPLFFKRLHHPCCPRYDAKFSARGKLLFLKPNPDLVRFLTLPKQAGRRL